jgi:hypothetical protein
MSEIPEQQRSVPMAAEPAPSAVTVPWNDARPGAPRAQRGVGLGLPMQPREREVGDLATHGFGA